LDPYEGARLDKLRDVLRASRAVRNASPAGLPKPVQDLMACMVGCAEEVEAMEAHIRDCQKAVEGIKRGITEYRR
jgi:hypothetical protein